jgi:hypothetical protein
MCGFETMPGTIPAAQMHYDHVGRAILDGPFGTEGSIPQPVTAGSMHSHHYEYTIPAEWNYANLHFIGLLMDETAGIILNANDEVFMVGTSELNNDLRLRVFPNPASDKTNLSFTLDKPGKTTVKISNVMGHCLYNTKDVQYPAGQNKITLDLSHLNQGLYFVEVSVNGRTNTHKIAVTR